MTGGRPAAGVAQGPFSVAPARHALTCGNAVSRDTGHPVRQARDSLRDALTCGNTVSATKNPPGACKGPQGRALGATTMGQGLEPDHRQRVALRRVREEARAAPRVPGRTGPQETRPDLTEGRGPLPALPPAARQPDQAHLRRPQRLHEAQGRPETPASGRETQAATPERSRTQTGPRQGTPAASNREAQEARGRGRGQAQGTATAAHPRRHPPRLRDLRRFQLPELPLPHLQGGRAGRRRQGPRRGPGHGLRRGLRQGIPRRVRRRGRIRRQVRRFQ